MSIKRISGDPITIGKYLSDLWQYRSLIWVLALRDIKIQYSQTALGVVWAILQPLIAVLLYSLFFYKVLHIDTGGVPYPLFIIPGIMVWFHFTKIIYDVSSTMQENQDLIKKVNFPRLALPISKVLSGLLNVFITLAIFFIAALWFQHPIGIQILLLPFFLLLNMLLGLTVSIWLINLTIKQRDMNHFIPYIVSFGIWVTPVFYPTSILPDSIKPFAALNPLTGILAGYRYCLIGNETVLLQYWPSIIVMLLLLVAGVVVFIRTEHLIVDHI